MSDTSQNAPRTGNAPRPLLGHQRLLAALARGLSSLPPWCTLLISGLILTWRRLDVVMSPQFWAEDGVVFFAQAYNSGAAALFKEYAGYLHTIPRLVAAVAVTSFPSFSPTIFVWCTLVLTLYVAARTQSHRSGLPIHPAFAFAVVVVPDAYEVLLFLANAQWVLAAGLLLLLISRDPATRAGWVHDVAAIVLLGLTGPFILLFAPLFALRAWQRRTRASIALGALALATAAVQLGVFLCNPVVMPGEHIDPLAATNVPGMRIGASLLVGSLTHLDFGPPIEIMLSVLTLAAVVGLGIRRGFGRAERVSLAVACLLLLASSLWRCRYVLPSLSTVGFGARYFFPQQLIVMWLLLAAAWDERRWIRVGSIACALWIVAVNLPRLREPGLQDLEWRRYATAIDQGQEVVIPVNPVDWKMPLRSKR